jgi:pimeloyl-ACP methyl ester carboxylesterase
MGYQRPSPSQTRCLVRAVIVGVSAAMLAGCAVVQNRILPATAVEGRFIEASAGAGDRVAVKIAAADRRRAGDDARELAELLEAARAAWPRAASGEGGRLYRAAVRRILVLQEAHDWKLQPPAGGGLSWRVETAGRDVLDPAAADRLVPADQIEIAGLRQRVVTEGAGLPLVASLARGNALIEGEPGVPPFGMAIPVTALVVFPRPGEARLELVRTLRRERAVVNGRTVALAADFSAPLSMAIGKGANRSMDLVALFSPLKHLPRAGLYQLQPHDPGKTPVVFVHGLMSRPETWRHMANELMADPEIRRRHEFWFFLYPTGLPVWQSAAILRSELDRFNETLGPRARTAEDRRNLHRKVLVGHSMGGLVSSLQIREGGARLWSKFSDTPIEQLPLDEPARRRLEEFIVFSPRRDIARVVFIAVPHRGSGLALRPTVGLVAAKVRFSLPEIQRLRPLLLAKVRPELRRDLALPANSLRFLRAGSPFLLAIVDLPADPRITIHSIIGDRGRNDAPRGGDGVVEYESARYPGAVSEKIVPAGHGAHEHPQAVEELRRILREAR